MVRISATTKLAGPLRVYLLGSFRVERDAQTIHFPTRKVESLLAYLVLHPEPHAREKLAALLWGDSPDEQARHSLRTALAAIRKELGDDILIADRETVQLNPDVPIWVDAREIADLHIDTLQSKIENYHDLLPDFYDDWILPERERLRAIYLDGLLRVTPHHRAQSEYAQAVECAQRVLATDATNEKAYQHLIFCLAAMGDRIAALKQFDECAKKLGDELGVEPSKETIALRDQIEQALTGGRSREALFTNVPVPLTSFIGREKELAELRDLIGKTRLLTLTGAGGAGKTRLAIQIATELVNANCFKHGVWWVELAALSDPAFVPQTVASVFNLCESARTPILGTLKSYLRAKQALLVLDNCEHLIVACAQLVEELLSVCPQLKILVTSREVLDITGEVMWRVPSLGLPRIAGLPAAQLLQCDAVQLFVQRAQAVIPGWRPNGDLASVERICVRLDGIPLAIELAAARVKTLELEQIAEHLGSRFDFLTTGSRTALPRHRTLRGTMDWSYDLLAEDEGSMLRQLAVFAGGWTLDAAEQVCVVQGSALDVLTRLVDKSLVVVEGRGGQKRYRLLETVREYAFEKLLRAESDEWVSARDSHLKYFLKLAEQSYLKTLYGDRVWMDCLEVEHENMRKALEHAVNRNVELAVQLTNPLEFFWIDRGHLKEGQGWAMRLVGLTEAGGMTSSRARLLQVTAHLTNRMGDSRSARSLIEESLRIARATDDKYQLAFSLYFSSLIAGQTGDPAKRQSSANESLALFRELDIKWGIGLALWQMAGQAMRHGDYDLARTFFEQSLENARKENAQRMIGMALNSLGELARLQGDYTRAGAMYSEAAQLDREMGNRWGYAMAIMNLVPVALHEHDLNRAKALAAESLAINRELEFTRNLLGDLANLAGLATMLGKHEQAARLLGATEASFEALGRIMDTADQKEYDQYLSMVREHFDEKTFKAAWMEGRAMTLDQAIDYGLENVK
ncbi:MAG: AfsR/SARP family transcriptional regulator [Acidobacteriota bacterium]